MKVLSLFNGMSCLDLSEFDIPVDTKGVQAELMLPEEPTEAFARCYHSWRSSGMTEVEASNMASVHSIEYLEALDELNGY